MCGIPFQLLEFPEVRFGPDCCQLERNLSSLGGYDGLLRFMRLTKEPVRFCSF